MSEQKRAVLSLRKPVVVADPVVLSKNEQHKALRKAQASRITEMESRIVRQRDELTAKEVSIAAYKRRVESLYSTIIQLMGLGPDDFRSGRSVALQGEPEFRCAPGETSDEMCPDRFAPEW